MTDNGLIAARDPYGLRPLCIGRLRSSWIVASETCAFDLLDAEYVREVEPGELIVVSDQGLDSHHPFPKRIRRCVCSVCVLCQTR